MRTCSFSAQKRWTPTYSTCGMRRRRTLYRFTVVRGIDWRGSCKSSLLCLFVTNKVHNFNKLPELSSLLNNQVNQCFFYKREIHKQNIPIVCRSFYPVVPPYSLCRLSERGRGCSSAFWVFVTVPGTGNIYIVGITFVYHFVKNSESNKSKL